ncbi:probable protein S-acyltransferase 12 isoform X2 [Andrographis paniculata]|uniref:probable protein S-acyltransferase 12 isoform X2 n=1 Tax=Andrographis paniculata TaxID=175694 RepID=UPI0021E7A8C1|nr:probable protein S-acyltransferase 12 isoform X2 [Andrographis paniculata]
MLGICKPWKPQQTGNLASPRILKRLFPLRTAHRSHRLIPSPTGRGIPHAFMDLNPFRLCSGLKFLGYFMILLLLALIAISYDAVIVLTCVPHLVDGGFNTVLYLFVVTLFHVLLVLLTWSYFMVAFRDPGSVPANWGVLPAQDSKDENYNIPSNSFTDNVSPLSSEGIERITVRYCNLCQNAKPPRCHHCSACQRCVLKMDHHCIWVVNCVGACNYKFFLLFVLYSFMETGMDTIILLPGFINFFRQAGHHSSSPGRLAITFLAFILNLALALSLLCFVVMHVSLLLSNTTSVEVHEKKQAARWMYDLGWKKNIEQVFGTRKALWLFPVFSKEDYESVPALYGLDFPTCSVVNV